MSKLNLSEILDNLPDLFTSSKVGYPWELLEVMKELIKEKAKPHDVFKKICGRPLERTIILSEDNVITEITDDSSYEEAMSLLKEGRVSVLHAGSILLDARIYIGKGVLVEPFSLIKGPTFIDDFAEIRHGAYIRGDAYIGKYAVVGHATEVKGSIFMDHAKAGHFAYVGDSILGYNVNLGAGTKLANLRFLKGNVQINIDGQLVDTGRRKLGAILGDGTQTGCNSVTNPGVITGKNTFIYPNTSVKSGYYPPKSVLR